MTQSPAENTPGCDVAKVSPSESMVFHFVSLMPVFFLEEGEVDLLADGRDEDIGLDDEFRTGDRDGPSAAALVRLAELHADALHPHDLARPGR